jgi:hypothetical protein
MEQGKWLDLSSEEYREYIYEGGETFRIELPTAINIAASSMGGHSHRIKTAAGEGIYVAPGWIAIKWKPKAGAAIFSF